ncbi:putative Transmembrane protein [Quillaja saponaria]|uniref:Transmembrane protein n=1 Tax=Quillaja saponaria TaxID=32244 RepID=A0AAD7Q2N2_QUISA|nr:putative Transmembrane protein [Quillaja saponaria]
MSYMERQSRYAPLYPRSSPEGSIRGGQGFYASEYRYFNRDGGFGRGHGNPKSFFQPPQPPPLKGDIFMEAGRLAAEYLVSQGLLPPTALSMKWKNSSFKKQIGEYREFRPQEGDPLQIPFEGRTSALARLGNAVPDVVPGRRRFGIDEFNQKLRRRGSLRSNASDWSSEYKRSGSWSDRPRASPDMKGDDTATTQPGEEQQVANNVDNDLQKSDSNEFAPKSEDGADSESGLDKDPASNENDEIDNLRLSEKLSVNLIPPECDSSGKISTDLLTLCRFAKVPTRTRSSLTCRGLKVYALQNINRQENNHGIGSPQRPDLLAEEEPVNGSGDSLLDKTYYNLKHLDSDFTESQSVQSADNVKELEPTSNIEPGTCVKSQACPDRASTHDNDHESNPRLPGFGSCSSVAKERGEKRALEDSDGREGAKKTREWLPSTVSKTEACFQLNDPIEKKDRSKEVRILNNPHLSQGADKQYLQYAQEKQPLPSSFRTCDLNLMEVSDIQEIHESDPIRLTKKEAAPVDVDLSISHSNVSGEFNTRATNGKEIEVIDLENDSAEVGNVNTNVESKAEAIFTGLEGFVNHAQNTGDIPDAQDGYGLMISELLGSDFPNCSSVPGNINSMHTEMGLHNGEGTLGEDDSIYMSLEEIPLSMPDF